MIHKIDISVILYFLFNTMELPDDLLLLIHEFSRPVTRPDWRTLHRFDEERLLWYICAIYNSKRIPVIERFVTSYDQDRTYKPNYTCLFRAGFVVQLIKN